MVQTIWAESRRLLQVALSEKDFETWVAPLQATAWIPGEGDAPSELVVEVPSGFYRDWLRRDWQATLDHAVTQAARTAAVTRIEVNATLAVPAPVESGAPAPRRTKPVVPAGPPPRYTFDDFVVGSSNEMAYRAARAVVQEPGRTFNPLFLYGATGLGKTHLLSAAAYALSLRGEGRVARIPAEQFVNDMVAAIQTRRMDRFRDRYRKVRTLIVDDVQFLCGKAHSQEEFKQTFNALYDGRRQIILASDRPPHELTALEATLRSRFESGCLVDVRPPDAQLRSALVRQKSAHLGLTLDGESIAYLADGFCENVRQLEGALHRVRALSVLSEREPTLSLIEEVLAPIAPKTMTPATIDRIIDLVSGEFGVQRAELVSARRTRQVAEARQLAMYLCRACTDVPLERIGAAFGGRDHSTVLYAVRTAGDRLPVDDEFRATVRRLEAYLEGSAPLPSPRTVKPALRKATARSARKVG